MQVTGLSGAGRCPDCGTSLVYEPGVPGLCPQCLLSLALRQSPAAPPTDPTAAESGEVLTLDRLAAGRILGERYQIRELLGRGGMGEVFRAFDLKLRVDVALKAVRPDRLASERAREALRREVRSAREVVSPNVCRIFDLVEEDGHELVSMEFVDGMTLGETLGRRGPLALEEAREIASQFLAGLEAIHQAGLVHRDFKPENVMITRAGRVVVMDFGLARLATSERTATIAGTPAYMSPEQSRGDPVDPRADVFAAAVVLAEMQSVGGLDHRQARQALWRALRETPPRVPDGPWAPVLRQALSSDPDERPGSARELQRALEEVTQRLPRFETKRPYPGLAAFAEEDAEYFFGRELEVEALLKKLRRPRLLALVAPSGAGKSSFLRAGLLPALPRGWKALVTTPGSRPFQALARALVPAFSGDSDAMNALLAFEEPEIAVHLFQRFRNRHEEALLIVDQFEELFTNCPPDVQRAFASLIARLVLDANLHVILSLRDDFLFRCRDHEALVPAFSDLTPLGRLEEAALRRALVQPALACGYRFEDEALVEEMIREVQDERGALPLLAFAASRLWKKRDRPRGLLTRAAYQEIGGVAGALAQHAEAALERIGNDALPIVREMFRNLITAQGTRAVQERGALLSVFEGESARTGDGAPAARLGRAEPQAASMSHAAGRRVAAEGVLAALLDARLLTSYGGASEHRDSRHEIEIIHESLLEAWPRLVRWRTQDADGAQLRDQLRQAARLWDERGRREDLLWTGPSYEEFRLWHDRYPGSLTAVESDYARAMTDRARRRKRRLRLAVAAAFAAITLIAIAIGVSRQQAVTALARAEASRLLAIGELRLRDDATEALAFATASIARADSPEARVFAMKALWDAPPAFELVRGLQSLRWPALSPDGRKLAAGGYSTEALLYFEDGSGPVVLGGHDPNPRWGTLVSWASDELLVTAAATGAATSAASRVHLWSVPEGRRIRTFEFERPSSWQASSMRLVSETATRIDAPGGYVLRQWTLPDGVVEELARDKKGHGSPWTLVAPDGKSWLFVKNGDLYARPLPAGTGRDRLVARIGAELTAGGLWGHPDRLFLSDQSGRTRVWSFTSAGVTERSFPRPLTAPPNFRPEPSGRWLSGDPAADQQVRVWDVNAWLAARPLSLRRNQSWYTSRTAFHPSGDWVVASTARANRLTFWPLRRPYPAVVDGYFTGVNRPLAFSPDGRWLATSWSDRRPRLWPLRERGLMEARPLDPSAPQRNWRSMSFDPRGRYVFAVGGPAETWLFPLDGSPARKLSCPVGESGFNSAAVSPSGSRVAAANFYGAGERRLCIWDVETGALQHFELPEAPRDANANEARSGYERGVFQLAFADEETLYTAGDGGLRRWRLQTGSHELVAASAPGYALLASFSADARVAFTAETRPGNRDDCRELRRHDLAKRTSTPITAFGTCRTLPEVGRVDASGAIAVTGSTDGIVRVGRLDGGEPHLLLGHKGVVDRVAISPDLRWVASAGEDNTLRLWPMPNLSKPPLHTLPHVELLAKLRSLTNIRVELDPSAPEGWRLQLAPFPGWKTIPEW